MRPCLERRAIARRRCILAGSVQCILIPRLWFNSKILLSHPTVIDRGSELMLRWPRKLYLSLVSDSGEAVVAQGAMMTV